MTMKLILFFIAMDLLTLLIYPFVYAHGIFNRLNGKEKVLAQTHLSPVLAGSNNSSLKEG